MLSDAIKIGNVTKKPKTLKLTLTAEADSDTSIADLLQTVSELIETGADSGTSKNTHGSVKFQLQ